MRSYRVELHLPGAGTASLAHAGERARHAVEDLAREGAGVRVIRSVYLAEEGACVLVIESPSPDALGEAGRRAALAYERIVEGGEPR